MKFICFIVLIAFAPVLKSQVVEERSGILIYFEVNDETFPGAWKTEEINPQAESLDSSEIERSINVIRKALEKYPEDVLKNNLTKIYVLKSMYFFGQEFGGTNSTAIVYVVNSGTLNGYTDYYIEKTFHHEFSSILLRNYPSNFKETEWRGVNKMEYGNGGVEALRTGSDSQEIDSTLNANGFLFQYGNSDMENDVNSFAENLFTNDPLFYPTVEKFEGIATKYNLLVDFYHSIDRKFTKKYFEKFRDDVYAKKDSNE